MNTKEADLTINDEQLVNLTKKLVHKFHQLNVRTDIMDTQERKVQEALKPFIVSLCTFITDFRSVDCRIGLILTNTQENVEIKGLELMEVFERLNERYSLLRMNWEIVDHAEVVVLQNVLENMREFVNASPRKWL